MIIANPAAHQFLVAPIFESFPGRARLGLEFTIDKYIFVTIKRALLTTRFAPAIRHGVG